MVCSRVQLCERMRLGLLLSGETVGFGKAFRWRVCSVVVGSCRVPLSMNSTIYFEANCSCTSGKDSSMIG